MRHLFLLATLFSFFHLTAQDDNLRYTDYTYLNNIKSVRFHPLGAPLDPPIIAVDEPNNLVLSFDDLDAQVKDYAYEIVHCSSDWQPSGLNDMEYLDGFTGNIIEDIYNSFGTRVPFTHYRLYLPNEDISWMLSGNYLLKVYEDEDEKRLAITRRFMVYDRKVVILANQTGTAKIEKRDTHQELDFTIIDKKGIVRNPRTELKATVLQNFRGDNAVYDLNPVFIKHEEVIFDHQDKVVFPAGNEFRFFDTRNLRFQGPGVRDIRMFKDGYEVDLITGKKRINSAYITYYDANGQFVVGEGTQLRTFGTLRDSTDLSGFDLISIQDQNDLRELHLRADYADVLFSLESVGELPNAEVYVFGAFTDWQLKPEFKMQYSEEAEAYYLNQLLKQGYYNYQYVVVEDGKPDISLTEGNFYETRNQYSVLVYYRPFGSRYDQLIGYRTFIFPLR